MFNALFSNLALIHKRIPKKYIREDIFENIDYGVLATLDWVGVGSVLGNQELGSRKINKSTLK